ncbi:MAG: nucleoside hydrolase [Candidatus Methanomethylicia archaeon]
MPPEKIILDCDPGIDDALAILLAFASPELKVTAITTVSGNLHVDKTSVNALKILELIGVKDVPVAKGAEKPLFRELPKDPFSHGEDGLGNTWLPEPKLKLHPKHASDIIIEEAFENKEDILLISTGPLTNIALALLKERRLAKWIKKHIMIGGIYGVTPYGYMNATGLTPVSEWNINVDPEAAKIVFNSGMNIVAIGLDVTTIPSAEFKIEHVEKLAKVDTYVTRFATRAIRYIIDRGFPMHLHDPMAIVAATTSNLFKFTKLKVDVETNGKLTLGQTVAEHRLRFKWSEDKPEITVACDVDGPTLIDLFIKRLQSLK